MAKSTIQHIKSFPISDRTKEMVSFIGLNQKLARTLGQIRTKERVLILNVLIFQTQKLLNPTMT